MERNYHALFGKQGNNPKTRGRTTPGNGVDRERRCGVSTKKFWQRDGDWLCPNSDCRNINFAFRGVCNCCGVARPVGANGTRAAVGGGSQTIIVEMTADEWKKWYEFKGMKQGDKEYYEATTVFSDNCGNISTPGEFSCNGASWLIDSGASRHMAGSFEDFMRYRPESKGESVKLADGSKQHVMGSGTIVCSPDISLSSVLHVPSFPINLLSISCITNELNCAAVFLPTRCIFLELGSGRRLGTGSMRDGLYYLDKEVSPLVAAVLSPSPLEELLLHHRLGHPSFVVLGQLYPDLYNKVKKENLVHAYAHDLVPVNLDKAEPIFSYPTSSVSSQNLLHPSQLASYQSNNLAAYVEDVLGNISDEIEKLDSKICSEEELIKFLDCLKKSLENENFNLKDEIGPIVGSCSGAKELTRHKIEESRGTAAAVLCHLSNGKGYEPGRCFGEDLVGIVALLGTVADRKMSRMLSVYLGEDNMLAVVCKSRDAANYIEKYDTDGNVDVHFGIHREAASLGIPINRRFRTFCLDAIRPYKGDLLGNKQKDLDLPFPHDETPKGFCGFAVNMISISADNLNIITSSGHGLCETLFYSLFGELQVYKTRNDMVQASPHLKNGAISLDGGVIKGDGTWLLGDSDPEVTFPVVPNGPDSLEGSDDLQGGSFESSGGQDTACGREPAEIGDEARQEETQVRRDVGSNEPAALWQPACSPCSCRPVVASQQWWCTQMIDTVAY